ncbi:MAG: alkyl sulfatase C-terminal domain-containing protein, partial [Psychromonas sp.]
VILSDVKEVYFVEMSNGNLNNIKVNKAQKADATLFINRSDVTDIILQKTNLTELFESGKATIAGDKSVMQKLADASVEFDETFEIVPRPAVGQEVDAQLYKTNEKYNH